MLKSLVCVCSIFVLLFPTVFLPTRAQACPVKLPETLLSLYRSSDSIYIATFAKEEQLSITEDTEDYTATEIKKHFDISSTLKGEPRKLFVLDDTEYKYKSRAEENENAADGGEAVAEEAEEEVVEDVEEDVAVVDGRRGGVVHAGPVLDRVHEMEVAEKQQVQARRQPTRDAVRLQRLRADPEARPQVRRSPRRLRPAARGGQRGAERA